MPRQNESTDLLRNLDAHSRVTGIGSVPFTDPAHASELILKYCPAIPYVPQLTRMDFRENMFLQFCENLPCVRVDHEKQHYFFDESMDRDKALAEFCDYVAYECYEYFKITKEHSRGLPVMLDKCRGEDNTFLKTQVTGPVTYLLSLTTGDKKSLIHDSRFAEAITIGLAMKGLWQALEIKKIGKTPLLFLDEPSLWGLGSAYMPVDAVKVRSLIDCMVGYIRERDENVLLGLHCCGNTDWGVLLESDLDIVSCDAHGFGDRFMLYSEQIAGFVRKGGFLALGIVPTSEYNDGITQGTILERLETVLGIGEANGLEKDLVLKNSLFTPACGMGPMTEEDAEKVLELTASLAEQLGNACMAR